MTKERKIIKSLTLREISGVTVPAQSPALVTIMKSGESPLVEPIVKYLSTSDGAHSFNDFLSDREEAARKWEVQEKFWPVLDSLRESVLSIVSDFSLSEDEKSARVRESVAQFMTAMQSPESSDIDDDIEKLFTTVKEHKHMSDELKKAADDLKVQVAELSKALADAEVLAKMSDADKKHMASLDEKAKDEFKKMSDTDRAAAIAKAAESEEVFKSVHGDIEIRKSDVGASIFQILKSQNEALAKAAEDVRKAKDEARTVELTKMADDSFKHLPGETLAKVDVLKSMDAMPEAVRGTLNAILKAADEALSGAFIEKGTSTGKEAIAKAEKLDVLAKAHMTENPGVTLEIAKVAVLSSNPDLYE